MATVDTIVFDKTGTLTVGRPRLENGAEIGAEDLALAARLAGQSRHPLARAVVDFERERLLREPLPQPLPPCRGTGQAPGEGGSCAVVETAGHGLEAVVDGVAVRLGKRVWCGDVNAPQDDRMELWLRVGEESAVRFVFGDEVRADAVEVIAALKKQGYGLMLLSGDREPVAARVAAELGIADFRAQVSPVDKHAVIEKLRAEGKRVLMVGDGLNDAAALAAADVSMSPSSALDITQNAADIVFQGDKLGPVLEALRVCKKAEKLVRQNFVLAFLYNALAVPLAMVGYVTPLVAAVAMASSSILVVGNAQRLSRG